MEILIAGQSMEEMREIIRKRNSASIKTSRIVPLKDNDIVMQAIDNLGLEFTHRDRFTIFDKTTESDVPLVCISIQGTYGNYIGFSKEVNRLRQEIS